MIHRVRITDTTSRIVAVKLVREMTGLGLKESLDLVDEKGWFSVQHDDATLGRFIDEGSRSDVTFECDPPLAASAAGSMGEFAIRYRSGPNKILAIKLVRELDPRFGLLEAKNLVEGEGLVRVGVSRAEAERIVGLFRELESVVEVFTVADAATSVSTGDPSGEFAIRYRSGPNKIGAIKLARDLDPSLGLLEAKNLIEGEGQVRVGVSAAEAERIVRLFREIGSTVDIEGTGPSGSTASGSTTSGSTARSSTSATSKPAHAATPARPATPIYGRPADDDDF